MKPRRAAAAAIVAISLTACAPGDGPAVTNGTWVGNIATEGNVTTVVNKSGSVWGGTAKLVEVASIGVQTGAPEYMLGRVRAVWITDERTYLIDGQAPTIRAYDRSGEFLFDIGTRGQGPGEYTSPMVVAAEARGRVFVFDSQLARVNVYGNDGVFIDTWPFPNARCCVWRLYPNSAGVLWAPVQVTTGLHAAAARYGAQAIGSNGPVGDTALLPDIEPSLATYEPNEGETAQAPFSHFLVWSPTPQGGVVFGVSDRYHFEIDNPDGSVTSVERYWTPEGIPDDHKDWEVRRDLSMRNSDVTRVAGAVAQVPSHKPAYWALAPATSGEVWVLRQGPSRRMPDCVEDPFSASPIEALERPCWENEPMLEVFASDGRYLGAVETPPGLDASTLHLSADGLEFASVVIDELGTIMVKRYRLQLPSRDE